MSIHRRASVVFGLAITMFLAAGCSPPGPADTPAPGATPVSSGQHESVAAKDPDTLVINSFMAGSTFDPAANYDVVTGGFLFNIYDSLIFYDGESTDRFVPWLATEVPSIDNGLIRDGGKTYVFPIRKGVTFHAGPVSGPDGKPVAGSGVLTPEDVAYTFQRGMLADPPGGPQWLMLSPIFGVNGLLDLARRFEEARGGKKAAEVKSIDDVSLQTLDAVCQAVKDAVQVNGDQVVFHLKEPFPAFLQVLVGNWGYIVDKEWVAAAIPAGTGRDEAGKKAGWDGDCATWRAFHNRKAEDDELNRLTNGTGPFKLTHWVADDGWTLTRNDSFWKGPAKLKEVDLKVVPEFATRLLALQNGDADLIDIPDSNIDQIQPLVAQGAVREIRGRPSRDMWLIRFNEKVEPENNGYIGSGKLDGDGVPPDFFRDIDVRQGFEYLFDSDTYIQQRMNGDAVRAKGPIPSNTFGFDPHWPTYTYDLDKAAEHFKKAFGGKLWEVGFTLVVLLDPAISQPFQRDLASINPKFKIVTEDQDVKRLANTAADLIPMDTPSWSEDFHDPDDWVFPVLGSAGVIGGPSDFDPVVQAKLDDLIDRARHEQDEAKRAALYSEIGKIAQDNALLIFNIEPRPRIYEPAYLQGVVRNPAYWGRYYWPMSKGKG